MDGAEYAAAVGIEHVLGLGVANFADGLADGVLDIDIGFRLHLPHHHHHAGGAKTFAGHLGLRILHKELIQNGVTDLVRHLVRMAFTYGFTGKQVILH